MSPMRNRYVAGAGIAVSAFILLIAILVIYWELS